MNKITIKNTLVMAFMFFSSQLFSHGLTMTTAELTLRNNNHLTLAIRTSLPALFNRMQWQNKPVSLIHLMAEDGVALTAFRSQLNLLFLKNMPITFADYALISPNLRLPSQAVLRRQIETDIANSLLPSNEERDHDRSNYLLVYVDGFIPKKALSTGDASRVEVLFPDELADIMVSFNRPLVQTLPASQGRRLYQETFY